MNIENFIKEIIWNSEIPTKHEYSRGIRPASGILEVSKGLNPLFTTVRVDGGEFDFDKIILKLKDLGFKFSDSFNIEGDSEGKCIFKRESFTSINFENLFEINFYDYGSLNISFYPYENIKKTQIKILRELFNNINIKPFQEGMDCYLIVQEQFEGLSLRKFEMKPKLIKDERYDLFYGKRFPHEKIVNFLKQDNSNLMLLYGDPGSGKSNYIKNILSKFDKKCIYMAPNMVSSLSDPTFIPFMMNHIGSLIVIEDAEQILSSDRNSATNNLLEITDGLLKDALNLKVICTFNCDYNQIDPALTRKGRLYHQQYFGKLDVEELRDLSEFLNFDTNLDNIKEPMSLADFFNREDNKSTKEISERQIGFFN